MVESSTSDAFSPGRVRAALAPYGYEALPEICAQIRVYAELLLKWNQKLNLTAIVNPHEILERHFGESLFALKMVPENARTLIDIGSGAGFPGLVLKLARPGLEVTLVEPVLKKAAFLKEAARALELTVRVRSVRIEDSDLDDMRCDCFTSRAIHLSAPTMRKINGALGVGGAIIAWLGSSDAEQAKHFPAFEWLEFEIPRSNQRVLLVGRKSA